MQLQDQNGKVDNQRHVYIEDEFYFKLGFEFVQDMFTHPLASSRRSTATAMNSLGRTLFGT